MLPNGRRSLVRPRKEYSDRREVGARRVCPRLAHSISTVVFEGIVVKEVGDAQD